MKTLTSNSIIIRIRTTNTDCSDPAMLEIQENIIRNFKNIDACRLEPSVQVSNPAFSKKEVKEQTVVSLVMRARIRWHES